VLVGPDGDDAGVQHHEAQPPVAFERVGGVKGDDGFLLPVLKPPVARYPAVVFVDTAVTGAPVVEFALPYADPSDEPGG